MTRKRYVKLLMGHGYSRNTANLYADRALATGRTYQQDYNYRLIGISMAEGFREFLEAVKREFSEIAESFKKLADEVRGVVAYEKAYLAAMDKEKEPEG